MFPKQLMHETMLTEEQRAAVKKAEKAADDKRVELLKNGKMHPWDVMEAGHEEFYRVYFEETNKPPKPPPRRRSIGRSRRRR